MSFCLLCDRQVHGPLTSAGLCYDCAAKGESQPQDSAFQAGPWQAAEPKGFRLGYFILAMFMLLMFDGMFAASVLSDNPMSLGDGRGRGALLGRVLEEVFGRRGGGVILSILPLVAGTIWGVASLRRAGLIARIIGTILFIASGVGFFAVWLVVKGIS
jgi:hypothetical protein